MLLAKSGGGNIANEERSEGTNEVIKDCFYLSWDMIFCFIVYRCILAKIGMVLDTVIFHKRLEIQDESSWIHEYPLL